MVGEGWEMHAFIIQDPLYSSTKNIHEQVSVLNTVSRLALSFFFNIILLSSCFSASKSSIATPTCNSARKPVHSLGPTFLLI